MTDMPPVVRSPQDVSPPPPPNTFERKYDAPALGKPEIKGPTTATPVARQPDKTGIPLTVRPQPGVTPRTDAGIPVVMQSPTWNTPDGKAPAQVESFDMEVYVMKAGDTYATVSQLRYRSDRYQTALAQFNRERDPRLANPQVGMAVFLPPAGYLERRFGVPGPGASPAPMSPPSPQPEATRIPPQAVKDIQPTANRIEPISDTKAAANAEWAQSASSKRYKVRTNDTIWSIAKTTLGNGERWPDILKLNKDVLRDVNQLQVGMVLRLPEDARVDGPETAP
jgi:LysM repeat protein